MGYGRQKTARKRHLGVQIPAERAPPDPYIYFAFDTEHEGDAYAERVEGLLERGIVPVEFTGTRLKTLGDLCAYYEAQATYSKSDAEVIKPLQKSLQEVATTRLTYGWVETWVDGQKALLKPSTLTKRVGLLARVVDWGMRRELVTLATNPVRLLPRGYATRGVAREKLWSGSVIDACRTAKRSKYEKC